MAQIGWSKAYDHAAVVTAEKHASQVGSQILRQGGNAVDAAVAVQFALAVTLPRAGNIGGGGFMVIHMKDGTSTALDFRETAPLNASRDMYIRNGKYIPELSREGALAVGVPGVVDGMVRAIERYGRLPLETVMAPAIKLAREGFRLSWTQAKTLNDHAEAFKKYEASSRYFTKHNGEPYEEGDLFVQEDLAATLDRIARLGRSGFYSGLTADLIVEEMKKQGGLITYQDLSEYKSVWRKPIQVSFRGYKLHIMPPPSSGSIAIAQMLQMLEPYNLESMGFNSSKYIHLVTEVMRRAFADRAYFLGDPDFVKIPQEELLSPPYIQERMENFTWNQATPSQEVAHEVFSGLLESSETTHFSVVDEDGNAVSVTTTLNGSFGSHVSVGGAGFVLNNEMDDFTAKPGEPNMFGLIQGEANAIEPGKRMLSSMSPVIVTKDGDVRMVLGAAGGPRIITATFQSFLNLAVHGMNAQQAISAPRFHHQWMPDKLFYEPYGINADTKSILKDNGHALEEMSSIGRGHIIYVDENGRRTSGVDPRGDGYADGY
jgi:gamma-glutamyltranspeptidase/glutathione hydrolase